MNKIWKYTALSLGLVGLASCASDEPNPNQMVTTVSSTATQTDFDKWLEVNFLTPYNINIQYRLNNNELDPEAYITPVSYEQAIRFAHITKHACLEAYDEVTGSQQFVRSLFPKLLQLGGSHLYNLNGTIDQGAAEGGRKISIYGLNSVDLTDFDQISEMFHTMHHEFGHIQNQTKSFSQEYRAITPTLYQGAQWSTYWAELEGGNTVDQTIRNEVKASNPSVQPFLDKYAALTTEIDALTTELEDPFILDEAATKAKLATKTAEREALQTAFYETEAGKLWRRVNSLLAYYMNKSGYLDLNALRAGFISAYSTASPDEDFVEVQATYIMETPHTWETILLLAGPGADAIKQKLAMVRSYLQSEWNINLDNLRDAVQRRHNNISTIDINSVAIK
ncbi:MAG: substrate import-associated zinc metallohydrolase lipoprotein [Porphyromonas sp.]|nr:substrate import-associated zinc metallohydrolase lipoprotein [Porphyromonas sp.]